MILDKYSCFSGKIHVTKIGFDYITWRFYNIILM